MAEKNSSRHDCDEREPFGQQKLAPVAASVASWVIACYQLVYGLAAFGVGPLRSAGISLPHVYAASVAVAFALALLSFAIAYRQPSPASLHPRPPGHIGSSSRSASQAS